MRTVPKTVLVLAIQITHSKLNRELVHLLQSILNYTGWKSSRNMRVTRNDAEAQQALNCGPHVPPRRRVPKEFTELIERVYVHRDDLLDALRGDEGARPNAVRELGGVIRRRVLAREGKPDNDHATVGFLKRIPADCFFCGRNATPIGRKRLFRVANENSESRLGHFHVISST